MEESITKRFWFKLVFQSNIFDVYGLDYLRSMPSKIDWSKYVNYVQPNM